MQFYVLDPDPNTSARCLPDYALRSVVVREGFQVLSDIGHIHNITWPGQNKAYSLSHAKTRLLGTAHAFEEFLEQYAACLEEYERRYGKRTVWHDRWDEFMRSTAPSDILKCAPSSTYADTAMYLLTRKAKMISPEETQLLRGIATQSEGVVNMCKSSNAAPERKWQPMSTAPKKGPENTRWVLLANKEGIVDECCWLSFGDEQPGWQNSEGHTFHHPVAWCSGYTYNHETDYPGEDTCARGVVNMGVNTCVIDDVVFLSEPRGGRHMCEGCCAYWDMALCIKLPPCCCTLPADNSHDFVWVRAPKRPIDAEELISAVRDELHNRIDDVDDFLDWSKDDWTIAARWEEALFEGLTKVLEQ